MPWLCCWPFVRCLVLLRQSLDVLRGQQLHKNCKILQKGGQVISGFRVQDASCPVEFHSQITKLGVQEENSTLPGTVLSAGAVRWSQNVQAPPPLHQARLGESLEVARRPTRATILVTPGVLETSKPLSMSPVYVSVHQQSTR